jgi:hypothetical protein
MKMALAVLAVLLLVACKPIPQELIDAIETPAATEETLQATEFLLCGEDGAPSGVMLRDLDVATGLSDQMYTNTAGGGTVNPGDRILLVSGQIENKSGAGPHVAMWANAYDAEGSRWRGRWTRRMWRGRHW